MKCPVCVDNGQASKLYPTHSAQTTLAGNGSFYDEDGVAHRHDPNTTSNYFRCSNEHYLLYQGNPACHVPGCDYGSMTWVNLMGKALG